MLDALSNKSFQITKALLLQQTDIVIAVKVIEYAMYKRVWKNIKLCRKQYKAKLKTYFYLKGQFKYSLVVRAIKY